MVGTSDEMYGEVRSTARTRCGICTATIISSSSQTRLGEKKKQIEKPINEKEKEYGIRSKYATVGINFQHHSNINMN